MFHNLYRIVPVVVLGLLAACSTIESASRGPTPATVQSRTSTPESQSAGARTAAPGPIKVIAVGDIMLDGTARPVLGEHGYDYPFAQVKHYFAGAQVVFGNLEGPLTERGTPEQDKTYVFRSPPQKVSRALKDAGFNVVSLANNHTLDYGAEGLAQTMEALDAAGIAHAGAGATLSQARQPVIVQAGDKRIAILAYSLTLPENFYAQANKAGTAFGHEAYVRRDIAAARRQADIVLVSFHWGQEGKTALRDYQVQLGHAAIDAGAAAVIGHHPHILQAVEHYKDGVILYSLGNFTFGSYSKDAKVSAVAEMVFDGNRVQTLRLYPINVDNSQVVFQPQILSGPAADKVVAELTDLSARRHTTLLNDRGSALLGMPTAVSRITGPTTPGGR
jgi:poly-gamma-glutamate capsule biosynthesis protein CapA/YwtB (metallophosphatase superfamily)